MPKCGRTVRARPPDRAPLRANDDDEVVAAPSSLTPGAGASRASGPGTLSCETVVCHLDSLRLKGASSISRPGHDPARSSCGPIHVMRGRAGTTPTAAVRSPGAALGRLHRSSRSTPSSTWAAAPGTKRLSGGARQSPGVAPAPHLVDQASASTCRSAVDASVTSAATKGMPSRRTGTGGSARGRPNEENGAQPTVTSRRARCGAGCPAHPRRGEGVRLAQPAKAQPGFGGLGLDLRAAATPGSGRHGEAIGHRRR